MNTEDLLNLYTESSFIKSLSNKLDSISNSNTDASYKSTLEDKTPKSTK